MITAKTNDGFTVELEENALDYIVFQDMAAMQKDPTKLISVADRFLGEENKNRLLEHLADPKGRVPLEAMGTAVGELLSSFTAGKNSASSPN